MSEIQFNQVAFKNFMSFGNIPTTVVLDEPGTALIVGENLDDGGSSGAGKTTLISAISYALYDKIPSGVSKDRLINQTNEKKNTSMEVDLTFTVGGKVYKVIRKRGAQGGIQLFEDGADVTPASAQAFNEKLEELLGFSYNMFSQVILFNGNSKPFLDFSVGEQRALIEELFRITTLSRKANACKKRVTQTDKDIELQKLLIQQQEKQNETHRRHVAEAQERVKRWEEQRSVDLQKLSDEIQGLNQVDFETEEGLHAEIERMRSSMAPLQGEAGALAAQYAAKEKERFPKKTEIALLEAGVAKKNQDLKKFQSELSHLNDAKCPYCLQKYSDAQAKIAELHEKVARVGEEIYQDQEKLLVLVQEELEFTEAKATEIERLYALTQAKQQAVNELSAGISEIRSAIIFSSIKDLTTAKNGVTALQGRLVKLSADPNPHLDTLKALQTEGEITVDYASLEALIKLQEHQQFLVKLLMDKNSFIRKNIISKTIPFLNKRIGYYTEKLNLPHLVMFQPDMSCEISQYARILDHGNLSNGEKKRLNLSLCLAFRDVMTYLHAKVNVLFTDEIDGGSLDSNCIDSLIGLLKHKAWDDELSIYIISHRPEFDGRCDRNIVVRKERGFSNLITQPDE